MSDLDFTPTPDLALILNALLDIYERRDGQPKQAVRVKLNDLTLPSYSSQVDPLPRLKANEQLLTLQRRGFVYLKWHYGQENHLLETVTLEASQTGPLYKLLERQPLADLRRRLRDLLLADRFRFAEDDWRKQSIEYILRQLRSHKSPKPFSLEDETWNRDLLTALIALPGPHEPNQANQIIEELPYRVFSVRVFNDSKRFEDLKNTVARLARKHNPDWRSLTLDETLREMGLVANPGHIYFYGPWRLVDLDGQIMSLAEFYPSVGIPTALVARLKQVEIDAPRLICVENLASFYELIRHRSDREDFAALCLWGNPSPTMRHLLRLVPAETPIELWADIDYGGLNILAHLRQRIDPQIAPRWMDAETLDRHARWARPLTASDRRYLPRLKRRPALRDMLSLIDHILHRDLKLEQEAVILDERLPVNRLQESQS